MTWHRWLNSWLNDIGMPVGWAFIAGGGVATWIADHGLSILGVGFGLFGAWIQWETLKLRRRLAERQLGLAPGDELE